MFAGPAPGQPSREISSPAAISHAGFEPRMPVAASPAAARPAVPSVQMVAQPGVMLMGAEGQVPTMYYVPPPHVSEQLQLYI